MPRGGCALPPCPPSLLPLPLSLVVSPGYTVPPRAQNKTIWRRLLQFVVQTHLHVDWVPLQRSCMHLRLHKLQLGCTRVAGWQWNFEPPPPEERGRGKGHNLQHVTKLLKTAQNTVT